MQYTEQWVWLPMREYPDYQHTVYSALIDQSCGNYVVAEFKREYIFSKKIRSAKLRFSADTLFQLCCNGECIATGPASAGGDFIGNDTPCGSYYSFEKEIFPQSQTLNFFARVQMMPTQICDYSKGHGGFMLSGILRFEDGSYELISTDESWLVRRNGAYSLPDYYDGRIAPDEYVPAEKTENIWQTTTAPIPVRSEKEFFPNGFEIEVLPGEAKEVVLELDMIYAGFLHLQAKTQGEVYVEIYCREIDEQVEASTFVFENNREYRGFKLFSAGNFLVKLKNCSDKPSIIEVSLITTCYLTEEEADTVTDDEELNLVLSVCKHTLKYCRQTHHLDSPRHCEPLACTGDYYIESLMTVFSFGDMRLAEFDILRTAEMLVRRDGKMFHTTYSLIWVKMLYDVYMVTGKRELLVKCSDALQCLLKRFDTYIGSNGLVENPTDYMFVDWIYIDGISLHHPPKALGQTCLNIFYFGALDAAAKIFIELDDLKTAIGCLEKKEKIRAAVNTYLYDTEKGMYFEGLNTPTREDLINEHMPVNVGKRYYLKQSNILAVYLGICDDKNSEELIEKIISNEIGGDYQPYFAHYLLEGIYRCGLRERYTLKVIDRWRAPIKECPKGLVEGFTPPEPTYSFDHSHAWGGTPLYSLPKALLGLEILEPGMRKIKLTPTLLGMKYATVELLTPFGKVVCKISDDHPPCITHPREVQVIY